MSTTPITTTVKFYYKDGTSHAVKAFSSVRGMSRTINGVFSRPIELVIYDAPVTFKNSVELHRWNRWIEECFSALRPSTPKKALLPHKLTFKQLRAANIARLPLFKNKHGQPVHSQKDGSDWTPAQWLQALTGELGEYSNVRKKYERGDIEHEEFMKKAASEIADVQCYLDILAFQLGIDLGRATAEKWDEVSHRCELELRILDFDN